MRGPNFFWRTALILAAAGGRFGVSLTVLSLLGLTLFLVEPAAARAQEPAHQHDMGSMPMNSTESPHQMSDMSSMGSMSFGGVPDTREASGTAWQPDGTPMHAHHFMLGDWQAMAHYNVFAGYDHQSGARGDDQFNSINWFMLMATKRDGANELTFRSMLSLEPWTTTTKGYPLSFQSGESYQGRPLVDRQHPHDFFMELAARYRRALDEHTVVSLYLAPSGEPALGPPAFPHRPSAMDNPAAPISHHWLDSTHIAFGVVTAGIAHDTWQLEGSWFNGREPDEHRWNIDLAEPDSYSGRFTWNPTPEWSGQVSVGHLKSPEALHPDEDVWRTTASVMHLKKLGGERSIATTLGWGVNDTDHDSSQAVLLESNLNTGGTNIFGRAEYVEKTAEELDLTSTDQKWGVTQFSLGASRELVTHRPWQLALGGAVTYSVAPQSLDAIYGDHPVGFWIFLRLRPAAMEH